MGFIFGIMAIVGIVALITLGPVIIAFLIARKKGVKARAFFFQLFQIYLIAIFWELFLGKIFAAAAVLSPPIFFFMLDSPVGRFSDFLAIPLSISLLITIALIYFLYKKSPETKRYFITLFGVLIVVISILLCWIASSFHIKYGAEKKEMECLRINPFLDSVYDAGKEFKFNLHAIAFKDKQAYGWSYRYLTFYKIPESIDHNIKSLGMEYIKCYGDEGDLPDYVQKYKKRHKK